MADATMPVRDVLTMITDRWDQEEIDAEAAANLYRGLALRLLDKVQGHPDAAGITSAEAAPVEGSHAAPYEPGEEVWTYTMDRNRRRQWFVDQRGAFIEADAEPAETPTVVLDADLYLSDEAIKANQISASEALASGLIKPIEVGEFVKGLHPESPWKAQSSA